MISQAVVKAKNAMKCCVPLGGHLGRGRVGAGSEEP